MMDGEDLSTLGAYISSNIQSKRRKIISLYATSMSGQKGAEDICIPALINTRQDWQNYAKKNCKYTL